jgi:pyridoxal phosphate enzyme (YggS family)
MDKSAILDLLRNRLASVEQRITAACQRSGRSRSEVTLVAVTKTISIELAALLRELGLLDLGESRPQELWRKAAALPKNVRWHLIGHLQRNKIAQSLPLVMLIHSVDSARLLQALDDEAGKQGRKVNVLLEVNTSGEASKLGFAPRDLPALAATLAGFQHVSITGLMTMAALQEPEACRPSFAMLRQLCEHFSALAAVPPPHSRLQLSMGMSNDFEVAIEEGADFVRLGSVLFEGLK